MQLLFVHDHVFRLCPDNSVRSPGRLPYAAWQRYLQHFSKLSVLARSAEARDCAGLGISSGPDVKFSFDHGYRGPRDLLSPKRFHVLARVEQNVKAADAVVARLPSELGLIAIHAARRHRVPYAVEVVACALDAYLYYGSPLAPLYAPLAYARMRRAISTASHAIYVTQAFLQRRYPTRGVVGVASNVQLPAVQEQALTQRLAKIAAGSEHFVLGFMGSLKAHKGLDVALRALAEARKRGFQISLRVAGDGDVEPWRQLAQRLGIQSSVQFDGILASGEPVLRWLDQLDIYLQPSRVEALPRSVIEAMSRGLPVLASDVGGIPELLPSSRLHRSGDWRELASMMMDLLSTKSMWAEDARSNWQAAQRYAPDVIARARDDFWSRFAEHVRARTTQ